MSLLTGIVTRTPFWVWPLLAFLIFRGLKRTRTAPATPASLMIMPVIVAGLCISRAVLSGFNSSTILTMLAGIILGLVAASLLRPARDVTHTDDGRLVIQGEWVSLPLYMAIFGVNYAGAVLHAIAPISSGAQILADASVILNGFSAGFLTTRSVVYLSKLRSAAAPA
jgi:hypothetical protein